MKNNPVLTDIVQVFSLETLQHLHATSFTKAGTINWGADREVSLRHNDTSVKDQWNGTCTSFAVIAAIENTLHGSAQLSERSLWDFYGAYSTQQAICAARCNWILEENYWSQHQHTLDPRFKNKGRYQLALANNLERDYLKVLEAIDYGHPCVVALSTPQDLYNGHKQVEATSKILRKSGHAMCVSGYKVENGNAYFLVKNSWGVDKGDNGYQYVAFNLFDTKGYIMFWEITEVRDRGEQLYNITIDPDSLVEDNEPSFLSFINA